ncbi:RNA-dependent RNA polymerase [Witwatersrand virus]|uniref:RNA-directed RNA polymerase L n=1 Tax=Witwatersrand virus TaxID=1678231 RepID=A0A0R7FK74_9VIRU|nr:RNA-dependent RNA polymerase [Witwatersrand virus]AKO90168.1 RNA-dependent RNA polymerase [Witwatersrand virus]
MQNHLQELARLRGRLRGAQDPADGKELYTAALMLRHDYFGYQLCQAYGIPYRNDVPLEDILLETTEVDAANIKIPDITPDNFMFHRGRLVIIDYKVSVSTESTDYTLKKYNEAIEKVQPFVNLRIGLCIIRMHPITNQIMFTDDEIAHDFGHIHIPLDFTPFVEFISDVKEKFHDSEEFMEMIAHGDVTFTVRWCNEECPELYNHPNFTEFMSTMSDNYQEMFLESINTCAYKAERWDTNLRKVRDQTRQEYEEFVYKESKKLLMCDGNYKEPSQDEIDLGWSEMTERIMSMREVSQDLSDQKPSIHFIWAPHDKELPTHTTQKLKFLAKILQAIEDRTRYSEEFKRLGYLMDIDGNDHVYETFCADLKAKARSKSGQVKNQRMEPLKIGNAYVLWEQQFLLPASEMGKHQRSHLLKDFFGIGKHKNFSKKGIEDIDISKPKILDFNDKNIKESAYTMMDRTKLALSERNGLEPHHPITDEYMSQIDASNHLTALTIQKVFKTKYWSCVTDISVLMRNILSISQYNRANTFRVAMCANNSLYALVMPSTDIKTKEATVVYCIIAYHKEETSVFNPGALHYTYRCPGGFLSISRAMRLDKKRCQRIVTAPGIFLTTTCSFKSDNETIDINDIMNFALFTSLNVTKSMLSLTEPSRYMIMNSLAVSSHVREYISEKFSPYTKTLFSVYMVDKIRRGCSRANAQRELIRLRNVHLTDFDITQKGAQDNRDLDSIWFPGKVTLKEYLEQIYTVFYLNPKGLHEKHHVMVDLLKTVIEIEIDQRLNTVVPWSATPKKQSVNLPILINSIATNYMHDTSYCHHLRTRIENRNNLRRSFSTISTFTSSKSCIKTGNFYQYKLNQSKKQKKAIQSEMKRSRIADTEHVHEEDRNLEVVHANYELTRQAIPDYIDCISTKVFDRLYELYKYNIIDDGPCIQQIFKTMKEHNKFYFTFFNKGQKTAKDREIFVGEYEAKMCMYLVERIFKERSRVNPDEMISEPGDGKLRKLEKNAEKEIRFLVEKLKLKNDVIDQEIEAAKEHYVYKLDKIEILQSQKYQGLKLEINADMSKWSAQDVFYKYFWAIALDPILYKEEKEHILLFFCKYLDKELIIPDEVLYNLLDQQRTYPNDIIKQVTNNLTSNHFNVKKNWLQGNFNYMSSYIHSCAMSVYKDIIKATAKLIEGECLVNTLVHSDDNQTSITIINNRIGHKQLTQHCINEFETICLTFGCQANMKKTYITNHIKEFVSLFNIYGEPFSIYNRFILTSISDCAYIGPYEDLASRISSAQTAIKHGCPSSLAWLSISIAHWISYLTYNMLPGQINDPLNVLPFESRRDLPIELGGYLDAPLSLIALAGLESGNLWFLIKFIQKHGDIMYMKEAIVDQVKNIKNWEQLKLSVQEKFKLKVLRYLVLDAEMDNSDVMGETSEMRGRSLLTPRKFTTAGSLRKLVSFLDFQEAQRQNNGLDNIVQYLLDHPTLLVTKGESKEDFMNSVLYRFNSKKFKESLSIQNSSQLFLEQILYSHKPIVDYQGLKDKFSVLNDGTFLEDNPTIQGRFTFPECFNKIDNDLRSLKIDLDDIEVIYNFIILNDPLMVTAVNAHILQTTGIEQPRLGSTCSSMPEFRNLRMIHYSPAVVLRAYADQNFELPGCDPDDLRRDVYHLEKFIETTGLKIKMENRIKANEGNKGKDIFFEIKELTRFYQICYEYVKSTEHKVKVYILPTKSYTQTDFCAILQGSLMSDKNWVLVSHLRPVTAGGHKGSVQKVVSHDAKLAQEAFLTLAHFTDTFLDQQSRIQFFNFIVENYRYKERKMQELLEVILAGSDRVNYLPILYRTKQIQQQDLDLYDARKSITRVTWNEWQMNRTLDTGPINIKIETYNSILTIIGMDKQLTMAQLEVPEITYTNIVHNGYRLLNAKHGLAFERMTEINPEPNNYYITAQLKSRNRYVYKVYEYKSLIKENNDSTRLGLRHNPIKAYCILIPVKKPESKRTFVGDLRDINFGNNTISMLQLKNNETARLRKSELSKMQYFEGPQVNILAINMNALMKDRTLMGLNFDNLSNMCLTRLSRLIDCDGSDSLEDSIICFSDDPIGQEETQEMNSIPLFKVSYMVSGARHVNYRNAISQAIYNEVTRFKKAFTLQGKEFYNAINKGMIENFICVLNLQPTNVSTKTLYDCFHVVYTSDNKDHEFHNLYLDSIFFKNNSPASGEINYKIVKQFLEKFPIPKRAPWNRLVRDAIEVGLTKARQQIEKCEPEIDFAKELAKFAEDEEIIYESEETSGGYKDIDWAKIMEEEDADND